MIICNFKFLFLHIFVIKCLNFNIYLCQLKTYASQRLFRRMEFQDILLGSNKNKAQEQGCAVCYFFLCLCVASNKICNLSAAQPNAKHIHKYSISVSICEPAASHLGCLPARRHKSNDRRLNQSSDA